MFSSQHFSKLELPSIPEIIHLLTKGEHAMALSRPFPRILWQPCRQAEDRQGKLTLLIFTPRHSFFSSVSKIFPTTNLEPDRYSPSFFQYYNLPEFDQKKTSGTAV